MKIWFGTTTIHFKEYKHHYLVIRQHLIGTGHILTDDWLGDHSGWIENNPYATRGVKNVYQTVINAINEADVSIIEFTIPNFSTSHQITYSLQRRKPTLVMRLKRDNTFQDSYIEAIDNPYLTLKKYTPQTYKDIIDEFLGYSHLETGQGRYNIVLARKHKYYLDWATQKYKKSRSEIIRELLDNSMSADTGFAHYLKEK